MLTLGTKLNLEIVICGTQTVPIEKYHSGAYETDSGYYERVGEELAYLIKFPQISPSIDQAGVKISDPMWIRESDLAKLGLK